jgi:hypothetical protein
MLTNQVSVAELCKKWQSALEAVSADKDLVANIMTNNYYTQAMLMAPSQSQLGSQQVAPAAGGSLLRAAQANSQLMLASPAHGQSASASAASAGTHRNTHNMVLSASGHAAEGMESAAFVAVDAFVKCLKFMDLMVTTCTSLQG